MVVPASTYSVFQQPEYWSKEDEEDVGCQPLDEKEVWAPEPELFEDWSVLEEQEANLPYISSVLPSQFTEFAFRMPRGDGLGYSGFSFDGRRHMRRIYDTPAKRILLVCARQTEKSTALGNSAITYSCMVQGHRTLYVSPSATQTKTFSVDRIKDPLETSTTLRLFTTTALAQNVFEKQFVNRSKITLRYAFLNADRCRGIPAYRLLADEFQDILSDNIPIIEQCTSHAPEQWKRFVYAGTPKSLDNSLEYYRANLSTQGEWVVPCDRHGGEGGRYWNILGEKNIGKKGLVCEKCKNLIDFAHEDAQWANQVAYDPVKAPFESYRISQLMVPWKDWSEILLDYDRYSRDKFYNEVLGISFDSGLRPLTRAQIQACCREDIRMSYEALEWYKNFSAGSPVFAGIDWGCHDEETRILTESGFKFFRDLTDEDKVAQWDPDTRVMSFVFPKARTAREWNQPLLHFKTRGGLDLMVTHTHRIRARYPALGEPWFTETAGDLAKRGGSLKFVGHVNWKGTYKATFVLPGVPRSSGYAGSKPRTFRMDDWVEFIGYLITEGGLCFNKSKKGKKRPACLKMSQRRTVNPDVYAKIQSCLDRMRIPYTAFPNEKTGDVNWTICGKQFWLWYAENIGTKCANIRLPRALLALSVRQLRILFEAMVDGDGSRDHRDNSRGTYYSTSKGLCEDFQEICIRLGLRAVMRLRRKASGNRKTMWVVSWSRGRDYYAKTPSTATTTVPYSGKVYCCTVPSGYIITERNGCISYQGNSGENSYTVLSLGAYVNTKFRIFYIYRFVGEGVDPEIQMEQIIEVLKYYNVKVIGADYGGGHYPNDRLTRVFGPVRLQKYQYAARVRRKVLYNRELRRWMLHRTDVMSDVFNAIKRQQIEFPRWEEFADPYGQDMLNIFSEYNKSLRMIQYSHAKDKPDDSFHSLLYCFLASMMVIPRPDIIAPVKEDPKRGPVRTNWSGPLDQGSE